MPKFSIIIPVYNAVSVLDICLDSILEQTFKNFEVVCVNDGSTDNSLSLLRKYQSRDGRVRILDQPNYGVSKARNVGLQVAKGEYIFFVDSDDWLHKRALEHLNAALCEKLDCVIFPMVEVYPTQEIRNSQLNPIISKVGNKIFSYQDVGLDLLFAFGGMCTKVTRREFLLEHRICFNEHLTNAEDLCVSLEVFAKARAIKVLNYAIYYYRRPLDGTTLSTKHLREIQKSLTYAREKLNNYYQDYQIIDRFVNVMIYVFERDDYYKDKESLNILKTCLADMQEYRSKTRNFYRLKRVIRRFSFARKIFTNLFNIKGKKKNRIITFFGKKIFENRVRFSYKYEKISERYNKNLQKVREKYKNKKPINICFLFNEFSKIKTDSLIDLLKNDRRFNVVVAVTTLTGVPYYTQQREVLNSIILYYADKKIDVIKAYNDENGQPIKLSEEIDIVFYQQPWQIQGVHNIKNISRHALTCYVPYFVPNYGYLNMDCMEFHKLLFRYYVLNEDYGEMYRKSMSPYSDQIKVVGHTELDNYLNTHKSEEKKYIIYAPHWSLGHWTEKYSTFIWSGYFMLEFAKKHPEFNWVFKPHPTLKKELLKKALLSVEEIQNYYNEWENIAVINEGPDYLSLFIDSRCLITDCGSFLTEYFPTTNPVIRLCSNVSKQPCDPFKRIVKNYYNVDSVSELEEVLEMVVINNEDPKYSNRVNAVQSFLGCSSTTTSAASKIVKDIEEFISK